MSNSAQTVPESAEDASNEIVPAVDPRLRVVEVDINPERPEAIKTEVNASLKWSEEVIQNYIDAIVQEHVRAAQAGNRAVKPEVVREHCLTGLEKLFANPQGRNQKRYNEAVDSVYRIVNQINKVDDYMLGWSGLTLSEFNQLDAAERNRFAEERLFESIGDSGQLVLDDFLGEAERWAEDEGSEGENNDLLKEIKKLIVSGVEKIDFQVEKLSYHNEVVYGELFSVTEPYLVYTLEDGQTINVFDDGVEINITTEELGEIPMPVYIIGTPVARPGTLSKSDQVLVLHETINEIINDNGDQLVNSADGIVALPADLPVQIEDKINRAYPILANEIISTVISGSAPKSANIRGWLLSEGKDPDNGVKVKINWIETGWFRKIEHIEAKITGPRSEIERIVNFAEKLSGR
jgi:hypothetical protein